MLAYRRLGAVGKQHERLAEQPHRVAHREQAFLQVAVVGAPVDGFVETAVVAQQRLGIALQLLLGCDEIGQVEHFHVRGMSRAKPGCRAFQHFAHDVELHYRLAIEAGDDESVARLVGEHALRLEATNGVAHRGAADVEPAGHLDFHDALPGLQRAIAYRVAQAPIGVLAAQAMAWRGVGIGAGHSASSWENPSVYTWIPTVYRHFSRRPVTWVAKKPARAGFRQAIRRPKASWKGGRPWGGTARPALFRTGRRTTVSSLRRAGRSLRAGWRPRPRNPSTRTACSAGRSRRPACCPCRSSWRPS